MLSEVVPASGVSAPAWPVIPPICGSAGRPRFAVSCTVAVSGPSGCDEACWTSVSSCATLIFGSEGSAAFASVAATATMPTAATAPLGTAHRALALILRTASPTDPAA